MATKKPSKEDMEYLHDMVARVDERLDSIEVVMAKQEENLRIHMKRSDQLEAIVSNLQKNAHMVQGIGAFIGLLALLATIVTALR